MKCNALLAVCFSVMFKRPHKKESATYRNITTQSLFRKKERYRPQSFKLHVTLRCFICSVVNFGILRDSVYLRAFGLRMEDWAFRETLSEVMKMKKQKVRQFARLPNVYLEYRVIAPALLLVSLGIVILS